MLFQQTEKHRNLQSKAHLIWYQQGNMQLYTEGTCSCMLLMIQRTEQAYHKTSLEDNCLYLYDHCEPLGQYKLYLCSQQENLASKFNCGIKKVLARKQSKTLIHAQHSHRMLSIFHETGSTQ